MLHIKKIKPLFDKIVVTGNKYEKDEYDNNILVATQGSLKPYQTVLAVGNMVRGIEVGNKVMINPSNYARKKYDKNSLQNDIDNNPTLEYVFNWLTIDNEKGEPQDCILFSDGDIQYVFEGEETFDKSIIEQPKLIL